MNTATTEKRPFYRKKRFIFGMIAALLALAVLVTGLVMVFTASPAVYRFEGAALREDAYSYWFSCLKYVYQIRYRSRGIEDTYDGWMTIGADGESHEAFVREKIEDAIRLRFIAASIFDSEGYALSEDERATLESLLEEFETESFGEIPFDVLKKKYGVSKNAVKQVALYEQKYVALYKALFSDPAVIYSESYREALDRFYKNTYARYNVIFVKDEVGEKTVSALEKELGILDGNGVSEERFTALEAEYADDNFKVTSGNYPHGIYLYAGESYERIFSDTNLLRAFGEAREVGQIVKKRNADDTGTYYVMRYALDDAPYLLDEKWVDLIFKDLPNYAGIDFYHTLLREKLADVEAQGIHENYTVAQAVSCKEHNIVQLLGNG